MRGMMKRALLFIGYRDHSSDNPGEWVARPLVLMAVGRLPMLIWLLATLGVIRFFEKVVIGGF